MNDRIKIGIICLKVLFSISAFSQTDQGLLSSSDRSLINPSYTAFNKYRTVWSSTQFTTLPDRDLRHSYTLTYSTWSENLQAGIGINYYNGLRGSLNTTWTGVGISYAKPLKAGKKNEFIPSLNLNIYSATKQWFVWAIDELFAQKTQYYSSPGQDYFRYTVVRPTAGLLWSSAYMEGGISGSYALQPGAASDPENDKYDPLFHLLIHFSMNQWNRRRGLRSLPVTYGPDILMLLTENQLISKIGYRVESVRHLYGLYLQNDYPGNTHGIAGVFGWKKNNIRFNIAGGTALSIPGERLIFFAEAGLGLQIPYNDYNKRKPWAPIKKSHQ